MPTTGSGADGQQRTADREIVISRIIDGPRELVFEACTDIRHLAQWWGPDGFTITTRSFEFRVGGVWSFVMHGPDGTKYPNWVMWREIVHPARITLLHGKSEDDPTAFESIMTFEEHGEATQIVMRTVFQTKELRDEAVERFGAIEGGRQTLGKLAEYIIGLTATEETN